MRRTTTEPEHTTTLPWAGCTRNWRGPIRTATTTFPRRSSTTGGVEAGPSAGIVFEELTDLYIQTNRLRDAVTQAEDLLKQNPDNLDARRMLGRIYTRMAGDSQAGKVNEDYLKLAIEQYQKVTAKDAKDVESWIVLGRLYRFANNSVEAERRTTRPSRPIPAAKTPSPAWRCCTPTWGHPARHRETEGRHRQKPSERTLALLARSYRELRITKPPPKRSNAPWRWRPTIPPDSRTGGQPVSVQSAR